MEIITTGHSIKMFKLPFNQFASQTLESLKILLI